MRIQPTIFAVVIIYCSFQSTMASAQSRWTITSYEWTDRGTYEKYMKPDQWLNKTLTFKPNSISFDFKGIQDFETEIDYKECALYESLDTLVVTDKNELPFITKAEKYLNNKGEVLMIRSKPNCYKSPFGYFVVNGNIGLFELRGVLFVMKKN